MTEAITLGLAAMAAIWALCAPSAWAREGDLDPSFGTGGVTAQPVGASATERGMAIDPQGRIVVVGAAVLSGNFRPVVARFLPNGSLDPGFDGDGVAFFTPPGSTGGGANAVTIDAQGGILVAADNTDPNVPGGQNLLLLRVASDGSLDTSFGPSGSGGFVITDVNNGPDLATSIALDSQGRIIVGGIAQSGGDFDMAAVRFDSTGHIDTGFGANGRARIDVTPGAGDDDAANDIAIDGQDRIVLAGRSVVAGSTNFVVGRLSAGGQRDPTFGSTPGSPGLVTTELGAGADVARSVALDAGGRIIAAGSAEVNGGNQFALVRYDDAGNLDATFSGDGKTLTAINGQTAPVNGGANPGDQAMSVLVDPPGRIVVGGRSRTPAGVTDFAIARYLPDGDLDTEFGAGGKAGAPNGEGVAVALDGQDRLVLAGLSPDGTNTPPLGLARFIGDAVAPNAVIAGGPADGALINDPMPAFEFTSSEAGGTFGCALDGLSAACASPFTPPAPLSDGKHSFSVSATDRAGNASAATTRTFTVDTKAPEIDIKAKKKVKTRRKKIRGKLKITTSEPAELTCMVDNKKPEECVKKFITPKLKKGRHKVVVTATDEAGNSSDEAKKIKVVQKP